MTGAGTGHYGILGEILSYGPEVGGSHVVLNLANRKKNKASGFAIDATTDDENSWGTATDATGATCMEANVGGQGMDHPSNANGLGRRNVIHVSARPMDEGVNFAAVVTGITNNATAGVSALTGTAVANCCAAGWTALVTAT